MTLEEERQLIDSCLQHDRHAQERLYRTFANKMFSVCLYYSEDRDEACDFLQEGFIQVFRSLDKFKFDGSLEGWIRKIVVRKALDEIRRKKRYFEVVDDMVHSNTEEIEPDVYDNPISAKEVIRLVNELPKKCALVLKLYAIEGYSHAEISEILEISVGTSKSQLNRARSLLKKSFNMPNG